MCAYVYVRAERMWGVTGSDHDTDVPLPSSCPAACLYAIEVCLSLCVCMYVHLKEKERERRFCAERFSRETIANERRLCEGPLQFRLGLVDGWCVQV